MVGLPDDRLDGFQTDFSFLLGAGFADPDHAAAQGVAWVLVQDDFDYLPAPKAETTAQPETLFRGIEDEAGEPFLVAVQIDDQTGALSRISAAL